MTSAPYLCANKYGISTLFVNNKPFLILGGELHNSASSNLSYMEKEVWPYLRKIGLNTVQCPITWESIERKEGIFDFSLLHGIIAQARRENVKVILLWFGLWKNGESYYVPAWIKRDKERFFRACYPGKIESNTISPFCNAAIEADRNAFTRLITAVKEINEVEHTIIMFQVENEVGFLGAERDFSDYAEDMYNKDIPNLVKEIYHTEGTWKDALGERSSEIFMAWYYASAVEKIAVAGKKIYPIPMFINAWIEQHPSIPGIYPSGGPVAELLPIWKAVARSIDIIAPDIYIWSFREVCEKYSLGDNPLFIPEARRDPVTASNVFYALGGLNAIGFSPFAVEDFFREDTSVISQQLLLNLNMDESGFLCSGTAPFIQKSYEILQSMIPILINYRGSDMVKAYIQNHSDERGEILTLKEFDLQIDYQSGGNNKCGSAGIVVNYNEGLILAGCNAKFYPRPKRSSNKKIMIIRYEDGYLEDGVWRTGRILNGDELQEISLGDLPEIKYIEVIVE